MTISSSQQWNMNSRDQALSELGKAYIQLYHPRLAQHARVQVITRGSSNYNVRIRPRHDQVFLYLRIFDKARPPKIIFWTHGNQGYKSRQVGEDELWWPGPAARVYDFEAEEVEQLLILTDQESEA
ncbi:hypothetical protein PBI_QUASAR_42 [Gordonia phage Quasar]|nr:hypothetical protein PBI_QUASAR_42 [Gordonia phage Quasar]